MAEQPNVTEKPKDWVKIHKDEIVHHVAQFYRTAWDWRNQGYHTKWDRWERNYYCVYDPTIAAKKQNWQCTMFVPLTTTHVEVIYTGLMKLLMGRKRPVALEPREGGDRLQAELHTDLLDYDIERSGLKVEYAKAQKSACIFGDGFLKAYWLRKTAPRRLKKPLRVGLEEADQTGMMPGTVKGEKEVVEQVVIKDNVKWEFVPIRDIFLEPNSTDMEQVLHRQKITYGELRRMADQGYFDQDSVKELWMERESDKFEEDLSVIRYALNDQDPELPRPHYGKRHTVWEYWGLIPRKWIDLSLPEETEEQKQIAEELTPGKIMIGSGKYYLASEENPMQSMEPPFVKVPYILSDRTYDIGVAQMLEGLQEEINEMRNQRVDNVNLLMNKIFVFIEKYVIDPDEIRSAPGAAIRLNSKSGELDDVRKAIMELPISDVPISSFRETVEIERQAQEVTGGNRSTIGTAGQVRDSNQTLGGMELNMQASLNRFTVYAYIIGCLALQRIAKKTMELIYQNTSQERLKRILGSQPIEILPGEVVAKWAAFRMLPPHELEMDYDYKPVDVFNMENRAQKRQSLAADLQLTASIVPEFDPKPGLRRLFEYDEFPAEEIEEILQSLNGPVMTPVGMGMGVPSLAKPVKTQTGDVPPPSTPSGPTPQ